MAQTIIKRVGGKVKIRTWIKDLLPEHSLYCEPFGGSFAVGFAMPKADGSKYRLVYNDLDSNVYNLFYVLRNHKNEFIEKVELTPYGREEFDKANEYILSKQFIKNVDRVEWARNYLIYNRQSMFGKEDGTWSISRQGENICLTWANLPKFIDEWASFFKSVFVENLDYKECIRKWDDKDGLFYIDPPYENVEKNFYHVNKQDGFDHTELFKLVCATSASCAISYYDSEFVRDMYKENLGFKFYSKQVVKHMQKKSNKEKVIEVLIVKTDKPYMFRKTCGVCF